MHFVTSLPFYFFQYLIYTFYILILTASHIKLCQYYVCALDTLHIPGMYIVLFGSNYRNGANSSPTAGAEVSLLLGMYIKQDEHISCYEEQSFFIQQMQVCPTSTVIPKGVTEHRTHMRLVFDQKKGKLVSLYVFDCRLVTGIMTVTIVCQIIIVIIIICEIPEVQEVFRDFRISCDKWFGVKLLIVVVHVCRELLLWFLSCLLHHCIFIPFLPEETNTGHINLGTHALIELNVCVI